MGDDNPQLQPEEQNRLNHHHVKPSRGSGASPISAQQIVQPVPFHLHSLEVLGHCGTVAVFEGQHYAQVLKEALLLKDLVPCLELCPRFYLGSGGGYIVALLLRPPLAYCGSKISRRHHLPGYEHVSLLAMRVGYRSLVEYHNGFLDVPVREMKPDVVVAGHSP